MKKELKGFVAGIVFTLILTGTTAIFADDIFEQIAVLRNPSTITVNGEALSSDHFEYRDRTYIPLREVCEKLGMDVVWNGETATIDIQPAQADLIINGERVDYSLYEAAKEQMNAYYADEDPKLSEEELENQAYMYLTERYLVCQAAEKAGVSLTETETLAVKKKIDAVIAALGEEEYKNEIALLGYDEESYYVLQLQFALMQKYEDTLGFRVEETDVREYYEQYLMKNEQEYWTAKHILFSTQGKTDAEKKEIRTTAEKVLRRIQNGGDFDQLMNEYSEDPGLANYPDGYTFVAGQMVSEFEDAVKSLKNNAVSGLVESPYGYHIIKRISSGITDSYEQVKSAIEQQLLNQQYAAYVEELRKNATIVWSK